VLVFSYESFDWHNRSDEEKVRGLAEVQQFIKACSGKSILVFTDGAVMALLEVVPAQLCFSSSQLLKRQIIKF